MQCSTVAGLQNISMVMYDAQYVEKSFEMRRDEQPKLVSGTQRVWACVAEKRWGNGPGICDRMSTMYDLDSAVHQWCGWRMLADPAEGVWCRMLTSEMETDWTWVITLDAIEPGDALAELDNLLLIAGSKGDDGG